MALKLVCRARLFQFREKGEKSSLEERIKLHGPRGQVRKNSRADRRGRRDERREERRSSERKFFPGYVLVQMEMDLDEQTWHLVKGGAESARIYRWFQRQSRLRFPKKKRMPDPASVFEEGIDKPRPKVLFEPGEVVRVVDGPFNDFNGVVENVNYDKSQACRLQYRFSGRSTPVELDFGQVEKG